MNQFLDTRTLMMVMGSTVLVTAASMACYGFNRRTYPGFGLWTLGLFSSATGFLLTAMRGILPDFITIIFANALVFLSISLIYIGFRAMAKEKLFFPLNMAITGILSLVVFPFFTYVVPSIPLRISILAFSTAVYFFLYLRILIKKIDAHPHKNNLLLLISLILMVIFSCSRGIYYLFPENNIISFLSNDTAQGLALLRITLLHIAFVMGLLHLNAHRLEQKLLKEEKRLRQSEERYRLLVEGSRQGLIIVRDNPLQFRFVSEPMKEISGYTVAELKNHTPEQMVGLIHPLDRQQFFDNLTASFSQKKISPVHQYRIFHKSGEVRWVEIATRFISYEGHPAIHSHFIDITRRKAAEAVNQAMFDISNAVNTAPGLPALYASIHNSLGTVLNTTNFFIALVDTSKREMYFPYHVDSTDDDFAPIVDFEPEKSLTGLVISRGKPVLLKKAELDERAADDGVWGPMPLIWMGAPLMIREKLIGVVAVQSYENENLYTEEDLAFLSAVSRQMAMAIDRKQAEDALMESEKKYRRLFFNAPAGIFEIDFEKQRFINVNDVMCRYSGYSKEEFLAMAPDNLFHEDSQENIKERQKKLMAGKSVAQNIEFNIRRKDGDPLPVLMNCDVIHEENRIKGVRVVLYDITQRKKMEKERTEAQRLRDEQSKLALIGQVAGKMAHDFNNILGVVMGHTELMLMDCQDPGMDTSLQLILDQTERGKNMTRNLVAFAKTQEPRQTYFNVNRKLDIVLEMMQKELSGIEVVKQYGQDLPELLADPGMIEHALVNLVQNAIHALGKTAAPVIILKTAHHDKTISIHIKDNGCGIPDEHLSQIYDPSFTLKGKHDIRGAYMDDVKGTGYGMANVRKYIRQHRGIMDVQSRWGGGTTVVLGLPVMERELTSCEKKELSRQTLFRNKRILLVEDEASIADVQYRVLTDDPCVHQVDLVSTGQDAMALFDENDYDLISLDYMLAGGHNGMSVYKYIRNISKAVPILFVSGNIEFLESVKELKSKDFKLDILSKPCRNKTYVHAVNSLMAKT